MIARFVRLVLALAFVAAVAACGGSDKVGDQGVLNFDQQGQGQRLGATTTTAPSTTLIPGDQTATTGAPIGQEQTTVPSTTAPPAQQEVSEEISMTDNSPWFAPKVVTVAFGGNVRFRNNGTKAYEVRGDAGEFLSGPIAPGDVYIWTPTAVGDVNYHDPNRPFAGGEIQVV